MRLSFLQVLCLIFVIAKILEKIDWSWWIVFLPYIVWYLFAWADLGIKQYRKNQKEQKEFFENLGKKA